MHTGLFEKLPFTDPVVVFTLLMGIILMAPIILRKLKIPGLIGLIISGMIIGPHGLNLVAFGESIKLLSTAGLLYLMFLAGLELNLREFLRNRNRSLTFGALTFLIPLIMGYIASKFIFGYGPLASLLIASMFSTHTLVAFPIASRLGITRSNAVTIAIGGTIITDMAVLLLLSLISSATRGELTAWFWLRMIGSLGLFSLLILYGVPRLSNWFFKNLEGESGSQYIYILAVLFASALLARIAGIEPIIGAFLAGLALSPLVPHTSALMNRISFIGNNLFIPIFLLSVGMMVDLNVFWVGPQAFFFTSIILLIALSSKFFASWATQKIFRLSIIERNVIFGLSVSHAAAIIAVVIVGYDLHLVGADVLNGAILIILVSSLVGSFITDKAGRKLALSDINSTPQRQHSAQKIMVSVANPETMENLVDFALFIHENGSKEPMYMLSVLPDDEDVKSSIRKNSKLFESAISHAAAADTDLRQVTRVDINVPDGIAKAAKELLIDIIVMGWNGRQTTSSFFFGSIMENLLRQYNGMVMVIKTIKPLNTYSRMVILLPSGCEQDSGFNELCFTLTTIAQRNANILHFQGEDPTLQKVKAYFEAQKVKTAVSFAQYSAKDPLVGQAGLINESDLMVVVASRPNLLSHHHYMADMPRDLSKYYENRSFIITYPEQRHKRGFSMSESLVSSSPEVDHKETERFSRLGQRYTHASAARMKGSRNE